MGWQEEMCVYKQKSGGRTSLEKTHMFGERMGHPGGIQAESNITMTTEGGRGEKRVKLAEATMEHSEGEHFKAVICQKLQIWPKD